MASFEIVNVNELFQGEEIREMTKGALSYMSFFFAVCRFFAFNNTFFLDDFVVFFSFLFFFQYDSLLVYFFIKAIRSRASTTIYDTRTHTCA